MIGDFARRVQDGLELLHRGRFDDAERAFRSALKVNPRDDQLLHLVGVAQFRQGRAEDAVKSLQRAISLTKRKADYHNTLGCVLSHLGRADEALKCFERAQKLEPGSLDTVYNIGRASYQRREFGRAIECFEVVMRRMPHDAEAIVCGARALHMAGEDGKAIELLRDGLARMPTADALNVYLAYLLLQDGRFVEGWRHYLAGLRRTMFLRNAGRPFAPPEPVEPLAHDLRGQTIVLHSDQGPGDDIFFLRFAPALRARGARVEAAIDSRLVDMVMRSGTLNACYAATADTPKDRRAIPIGDVPGLLGEDVAAAMPTLRLTPLPERVAELRARLSDLVRPLIGIAWWAGSPHQNPDPTRPPMLLVKEIPLGVFAEFAGKLPGTLVVIQRGTRLVEIEALEAAAPGRVQDCTALNDDLEGMLALLSLLDDYVGVSSTNVHLRTALGLGGRVLVTGEPEFRWMGRGTRSPWFPAWTVYRHGYGAAWPNVLGEVVRDVRRAFDVSEAPILEKGSDI